MESLFALKNTHYNLRYGKTGETHRGLEYVAKVCYENLVELWEAKVL